MPAKKQQSDTIKYEGGIIRPRGGRYQAEYHAGGQRARTACATIDDAKKWIRKQNELRMEQGNAGFRLTPKQTQDAHEALSKAGGRTTLSKAVDFWNKHHKNVTASLSVQQTFTRQITAMRDRNLRPRTIRTRESRLKTFLGRFGERKLMDLTAPEIEAFVDEQTIDSDSLKSARSRRNLQAELQAFFNWAEKDAGANRGFENNLIRIPAPVRDAKANAIARPADVKKLLHYLEKKHPQTAIAMAVACFAGLRSAELNGLQWEDVDFEENEIRVRAETSKTRFSREVPIEPNLLKWLEKYQQDTGPVSPLEATRDENKRKAIQDKKITWPANAARHSYGTYFAKHHGSYSQAADNMGHVGGIRMFVNAYKGNCTKRQAADYWKIVPDNT